MPPSCPSNRPPTIKDVARAADVAPSTVSQALNGKKHVDEKTRQRVLDAVKTLGYRPNVRAQHLRGGGMRSIALMAAMPLGVLAGPTRLGFLMELAAAAAEAALSRGLVLMLVPPSPEGNLLLHGMAMDGALVLEPADHDPQLNAMLETNLPVVCLSRSPEHPHLPYVDLMATETAEVVLAHMLDIGIKHPALLVGCRGRSTHTDTELVYRNFCATHGFEPIIRQVEETEGEAGGEAATAALLDAHPETDCLYALIDAFAVGAVHEVQRRGLRIPEDIRIITRYDGLRARTCTPQLTAVNLHLDEVGSLAVEELFNLMSGIPATHRRPAMPELVVRSSSVIE